MRDRSELGPLLGHCAHLVRERLDVRLSRYEITPAQTHVLLHLDDHGGSATQRMLTEHLRVRPSTANGILDRLEEKDFVRRSVSVADARCRLVTLTESGQALLDDLRINFQQVEKMMVNHFSSEETAQLQGLLSRMICNLEEDRGV